MRVPTSSNVADLQVCYGYDQNEELKVSPLQQGLRLMWLYVTWMMMQPSNSYKEDANKRRPKKEVKRPSNFLI